MRRPVGVVNGPLPPHLLVEDFLPEDQRAGLLRWALDSRERFRAAGTDQGVHAAARDALSLRDLGPWAEPLRARAMTHLPGWIARLKVTPFEASLVELELVAHNHGAHFTIHSDTYRSDQPARGDRMLSAVYYLHDAPRRFAGGALRLHRLGAGAGDPGVDVSPETGRLVVFPSWWPHEVMPVTCESRAFEDSRFSLNCWLYRARAESSAARPD